MINVQHEITERCLELLRISNQPRFVLDVGCGSGLSGKVLEEHGHVWVGCDVSRDMLNVAGERIAGSRIRCKDGDMIEVLYEEDGDEEVLECLASTGDLIHHDMGTGLPFRAASFDACISVSAIQWLCYSNSRQEIPKKRLMRFFGSLYHVLRRGGRAVLQFYPQMEEHAVLIAECATRVGFGGGIVVDYPNSTKAKKHYLVLTFDRVYKATPGKVVDDNKEEGVQVNQHEKKGRKNVIRKKKGGGKSKEWILQKKEMQRKKGKKVRLDTKYTGRKRPTKF